jgi:C4-dicarboxylate-specific signal transduction histidine kinase
VIIEDVNMDPRFAPHRRIAALTGFRAVQSTPLFSRSGKPLGMISTHFRQPHHLPEHELRFLDLYARLAAEFTERKRTEEELRKVHAELAHVTRLTTLGEMTASIAHEVNQPLGAIVTNGQACLRLLSHDHPDLDEARHAVESMIADGIRSSEVIKRIRRLLKKSRGGKSSHNINNIVREVLALVAPELAKNEINVRTQLAASLPYVIADRVQILQVVLNLILNSKEAMSMAGWLPRDLLIGSEQAGDEIMVTVADSGVGIAGENRERAFEPFFTTKEAGLGLGLSVSKTIINAHGGRLWSMPAHGRPGTIFRFTLPVTENGR